MVSFGNKFEEAKMMFLHHLKAPECSGHLWISSLVFKNTQYLNQVIKISGQLFVVLLYGFFMFLCDQLQAWILNKWESIFENGRDFLFITYPKTKTSLSVYTTIIVLELQVALWDPCFTISPNQHYWQGSRTFWNSTWWTSKLAWLTTNIIG